MDQDIEFKMKTVGSENQLNAVEIYRIYRKPDGTKVKGYVDSIHAMSYAELLTLKNFLQEYLHKNDWY